MNLKVAKSRIGEPPLQNLLNGIQHFDWHNDEWGMAYHDTGAHHPANSGI
jgi:hypothetical protein